MKQYLLRKNSGEYVTTIYSDSVTHTSNVDNGLKVNNLELAKLLIEHVEFVSKTAHTYTIVCRETTLTVVDLNSTESKD